MEMNLVVKDLHWPRSQLIDIVRYDDQNRSDWDDLIDSSSAPNILFFRDYMEYHKDSFKDYSLLFFQNNKLIAVFPAAISPLDSRNIVSHPGLTFGGLVSRMNLSQDQVSECLSALIDYYSKLGFKSLLYKAIPSIYHRRPAEQDQYFLWKAGFECFRIDLSVSINLNTEIVASSRRLRGLKKAQRSVQLSYDLNYLDSFWELLANNLKQRHSARPTHSLEEIKLLISRFPNEIVPLFALNNGTCVAGVVIYKSHNVHHAQYISACPQGQDIGALDLIFSEVLLKALGENVSYFDFGISTINNGSDLNEGLYSFKYEFGGGGICHRFFTKEL